jgi:predicted MFS family arabinose efflux permease
VLYATRGLGLDGAMLGAVYTVGGLASVAGATLVRRTTSRFGIGPSMVGSILLLTVAGLLVLAAGGPPIAAAAYLAARGAMTGFAASVFNVTSSSVYQAAIPNRLQGRVAGAGQVLGLGLIPVSAIAGGWLGENVGLWNTLAISIGCQFLAFVYVALSPLRGIRTATDFPAVA